MPRSTEEKLLKHFREQKRGGWRSSVAGAGALQPFNGNIPGHTPQNLIYPSFGNPPTSFLPPVLTSQTAPLRDVTFSEIPVPAPVEEAEPPADGDPSAPQQGSPHLFADVMRIAADAQGKQDWESAVDGIEAMQLSPDLGNQVSKILFRLWQQSTDWGLMMETSGAHKMTTQVLLDLTRAKLIPEGLDNLQDIALVEQLYNRVLHQEYVQRLTDDPFANNIRTIEYNSRSVYEGVRQIALQALFDVGVELDVLPADQAPSRDDPRSWKPSSQLDSPLEVYNELISMIAAFSQIMTEELFARQAQWFISQAHKEQLETLFQEVPRVASQVAAIAQMNDPSWRSTPEAQDIRASLQKAGQIRPIDLNQWRFYGKALSDSPLQPPEGGGGDNNMNLLDITLDIMNHGVKAQTLPGWMRSAHQMMDVLEALYPSGPGTKMDVRMSLNEANAWCRQRFQQMQFKDGVFSQQVEREQWSCDRIIHALDALPEKRHDYIERMFQELRSEIPAHATWLLNQSDALSASTAKNAAEFSRQIKELFPDSNTPIEGNEQLHEALYESLQFFWQQLYEWLITVAVAMEPEMKEIQPWGLNIVHTCQLALALIHGSDIFAWMLRMAQALLPDSIRAKANRRAQILKSQLSGEEDDDDGDNGEDEEEMGRIRAQPHMMSLLVAAALM